MEESGSEGYDKYEKRIKILESKLKKTGEKVASKETCWPYHAILGGVAPLLIGVILWFVKPGFVVKKDGADVVLDYSKLFIWDLMISVALWAALYGHYKYFGSSGKVCSK